MFLQHCHYEKPAGVRSTWVISVQIPNAQVISIGAKLPQAAIPCPARASTTSGCNALHNILKSAKVVKSRRGLGSKRLKNDSGPHKKRHNTSLQCVCVFWLSTLNCQWRNYWSHDPQSQQHCGVPPSTHPKPRTNPKHIRCGKGVHWVGRKSHCFMADIIVVVHLNRK